MPQVTKWIVKKLKPLIKKERSHHKLAFSFAVGSYIAFSPFIGFHTVMTLLLAHVLRLNLMTTFAGSLLINNPWTMVPIYSIGYFFGVWFCSYLPGTDIFVTHEWLVKYIGISGISVRSFLIGGNLLGIIVAVILYPIMRHLFIKVLHETDCTK